MLRALKAGKALRVTGADFFRSGQRHAVWTRHLGVCRKYGGEMLWVKVLLIKRTKIAIQYICDFRSID